MRALGLDRQAQTIVTLRGRLDATGAASARELLHRALDIDAPPGTPLVVDMSGVDLVDATGLGVLVGAQHRASRLGRDLTLRGLDDRFVRSLCRAGMWRVLHMAHHKVPA